MPPAKKRCASPRFNQLVPDILRAHAPAFSIDSGAATAAATARSAATAMVAANANAKAVMRPWRA